jgi:hypothetical protein
MRASSLPGFVAENALAPARGRYWAAAAAAPGGPAVLPQARLGGVGLGGFGGRGGGGYGFWCEIGCNVAFAACTAACAALTGPGAAACIIGCSTLYQICNDGC